MMKTYQSKAMKMLWMNDSLFECRQLHQDRWQTSKNLSEATSFCCSNKLSSLPPNSSKRTIKSSISILPKDRKSSGSSSPSLKSSSRYAEKGRRFDGGQASRGESNGSVKSGRLLWDNKLARWWVEKEEEVAIFLIQSRGGGEGEKAL